ncbi:hypothetical protein GXW83_20715 [Streptacidiphilus sp. PB12-B1b]|uniref:hypothetical protein n=1 Tax=Streptacidiphilus sp. PB12-B1b TaxID=2705012 RepID=UPI0015FCEC51|nr:hypothetical protein [Streptacidiphilus sp. PB12-B1b]QMU77755.1 hypothetical protein GXW83_20715 [Streptacidiphilus sp. PB12-B1b]
MRAPLRTAVAAGLALACGPAPTAPARADTVLRHVDWACGVPYSGELRCTPPLAVPPGGHLWIGDDTGGPTVFTVYQRQGGAPARVGWIEMLHGQGLAYTNTTAAPVVLTVTLHADAPTDRCGTRPEHGFLDIRR